MFHRCEVDKGAGLQLSLIEWWVEGEGGGGRVGSEQVNPKFQDFLHLCVRAPRVWVSSGEEEEPVSGEEPERCSSSSGR